MHRRTYARLVTELFELDDELAFVCQAEFAELLLHHRERAAKLAMKLERLRRAAGQPFDPEDFRPFEGGETS
jgi:hypothetical protein